MSEEAAQDTITQDTRSDSDLEPMKPLPDWIRTMRQWPDTLHWAFDSTGTYRIEDLEFFLRVVAAQDVSEMRFHEHPMTPEIVMMVSPIPKWNYARNLAIDSLVFFDPLKDRRYPGLPILSFKRAYENETVRTLLYANLADQYLVSPDLEDGQPVQPTLYLSWDDRTIIAELPDTPVIFVTDLMEGREEEEELPPDYRSNPVELPGG